MKRFTDAELEMLLGHPSEMIEDLSRELLMTRRVLNATRQDLYRLPGYTAWGHTLRSRMLKRIRELQELVGN